MKRHRQNERRRVKNQAARSALKTITKKFLKAVNTTTHGRTIIINHMRPWGCVYGSRDNAGLWTFTLQENATVTYTKLVVGAGTVEMGRKDTVTKVIATRQIFPNAGGVAMVPVQRFEAL